MSDAAKPGTHTIRIREGDQTRVVSMEKHEFILGRDKSADIPIHNVNISRRHVAIRVAGFVVFVSDLGSANGTFIADQEVKPGEEAVLSAGAEVMFGNVFVSVVPYVAPVIKRPPLAKPEATVAQAQASPSVSPAGEVPASAVGEAAADEETEDEARGAPLGAGSVSAGAAVVAIAVQREKTRTEIDAIQAETVRVAEALLAEAKLNADAIVTQARREADQFREELRRDREAARGEVEILRQARDRKLAAELAYQDAEARRESAALAQAGLEREVTDLRNEKASLEIVQRELGRESEARLDAAEKAYLKSLEQTGTLEERRIELELELARLGPSADQLRAEHGGLVERDLSLKEEINHGERAVQALADQRDALAVQCAALDRRQGEAKSSLEVAQASFATVENQRAHSEAKRDETQRETENLESRLRALQVQMRGEEATGEALRKSLAVEREAQVTETRRQAAVLEAQEAEVRVKKLNLEAVIGEMEVRRISSQRDLEVILTQQAAARTRVAEAEGRVVALRSQAQEVQTAIESARQDFSQIKNQLTEQAGVRAVMERSREQSQADLRAAQAEGARGREELVLEAQASRRKLEGELASERVAQKEKIDREFTQKAQAMEREIAEAKLKELALVGQMQAHEAAAARARAGYILDEIVKAVSDLAERGSLAEAQTELRESVKAALEGRTVASRSAEGAERTRRFWKKIAVRAAGPLAAVLLLAAFPGAPGAIRDRVARGLASDKNDGGVFLEQILQRGLKYQPAQDQSYRDTYANNIIYLEHYMEMKLGEKEQREWTLILNDFIVGKLGLSDRVIPDFISAETVMFKELFRVREGLLPQYLDQGLAHLQETEKTDGAKLIALLQGPENYASFRAFERGFYLDYLKRRTAH